MTDPHQPAAARTLLRALLKPPPGGGTSIWSVRANHGTGAVAVNTLGDPRGDGSRPRVEVQAPCESYLVQARHVDGRAFVACWVHRAGDVTGTGARKWKADMVWRGRHEAAGEHTPKRISASELKVYVAAPDAAGGLAAIEELRAEQARKTATARRARAAEPVDVPDQDENELKEVA